MPYLSSGKIDLYYEIQGEGEPIVLIPGLMGDIYTWTNPKTPTFLQSLKNHFQVIMFDPRCAGKSGCQDQPFEFQVFVEDLKELIDHLGFNKVHIYGVSMGSMIAINFVSTYPEMVNKVILACSAPNSSYMTEEAKQILRSLFTTNTFQEDMMKIYEFLMPRPVFEQQKPILEQLVNQPREYPRPGSENYHQQLEASFTRPDNTQKLKELDNEFLILKPGYDPLIDPSGSDKLHEIISNSKLIEYKNAIHSVLPPPQNPDMEPLISFLKS